MATAPTAPSLGFLTKVFYGTGSIGYGIKDVAFRSFLLLYYNQVVGVRAELVSFAILVALVVDAISDPIVGQWSDTVRTRWGRRHPFMLASAIPAAGSLLFLFFPPGGMSDTQTFWYILVVGCCVRTFITFFEIPSSALAPELTADYDERTSIASYRYFFAYLGGVGMLFLTLLVFLAPTEEYPVGQLNPAGYQLFAVVGAAVMFAAILLSSFGTLHRVKYFKMPPRREKIGPVRTLKQMGQTFAYRGFLAILAFGVLKYTSVGMTSALNIYFGTYLWGFSSAQLAILTLDSLAGAFLALFLAPYMSRKIGKRNAAFVLAVVAVIFASAPYLLRFAGLMPENGDPMLVAVVFFFTLIFQLCGVSSAVLTHAMIGDIVEVSQLQTGRRSEGLFYAANTLMQKSTSGLGVFAAGMLVAIVGIVPGSDPLTIDPEIPRQLALVYVPTLIVLYIGGAGFLFAYRIDREGHEANVAELRRQERDQSVAAEEVPDPS
jgi:Na+/melibiose symporter-like transporter